MPAVTRSATKKQTARNRRAQRRQQQQEEPARQPQRRRRDHRQEENEENVHVREERNQNQLPEQQEIFDPFEEHQQEPYQHEPPRQHQQDEHQQEGVYGPRHMHPLVYQFLQYRKHRPKPHFQPQGFFCGSPNNANGRPLGSPYQCLRKGFGASSSSFIRDLDSFFNEMGL